MESNPRPEENPKKQILYLNGNTSSKKPRVRAVKQICSSKLKRQTWDNIGGMVTKTQEHEFIFIKHRTLDCNLFVASGISDAFLISRETALSTEEDF